MLRRPQSNPLICFSLTPPFWTHIHFIFWMPSTPAHLHKMFCQKHFKQSAALAKAVIIAHTEAWTLNTSSYTSLGLCVVVVWNVTAIHNCNAMCCILTADVCMNYLHLLSVFSLTTVMTEQLSEENLNKLVEVKHLSTYQRVCVCLDLGLVSISNS